MSADWLASMYRRIDKIDCGWSRCAIASANQVSVGDRKALIYVLDAFP